ncbi:hypothetical protein L5515_010887 [Caenorhabditis briggsae]|uniref:Tyr recombinase domain-containing protein n=2 Tax=Caenorhabditis briggsae TaxID=6238 RepID=A0AAE9JGB9_CAEBR|nr:hypothetical protein L5515_010887 [Caenorhabditis briggsae]
MHLVDSLGKAPIEARAVSTMKAYAGENQRRINWSKSLPASLSEEHRFTLYLVDRAMSAGSSSLAKAAAAFKLANDGLSPFASQLVSDVIKAQRRKESESRAQPTQVSVNTVSKIVDMVQDDEKSERNALVVTLSFYGLLRAEEASMLKWSDVHQSGNMLKLKIRRAKNDQLARGRETFCDWPEGSKRDCLLKRFRARASMRPGLDFVFQNILNGTKLTPSAISGIAKDTLAAAGVSATHHSLRRGRANHLQQSGVDFQAIKETGRDTMQRAVHREELNKLVESGVVVETVSPKVVSSLHVAVNDEAIRRQRRVSHAVATTIKEHPEIDTSIGVPLSKGSRNHVQLEQMSFNGFEKPRSWDWHEGHKAAFFESLVEEAERAGLMHLVDSLGKAPIEARAVSTMKAYAGENQRRINWSKSLPASLSEEHRFTLYLVDRAMSAGSSSLAKAAAAFKLANDGLSPFASQLVSDVIKAQRRKESESRAQPTQVSVNTVSKIVDMVQDDEKSERNALVVTLSFYGLLRAEEASMLKWSDVHQSGNMLKLKIRRAKNDQLARGRETFCDWPEGSKRDCLLKRFRARASMRPGLDFVFQNILNGTKLTPSAISGIAKDTLAAAGVSATHHSLRRGRANHLQQSGVDFQAIKETGRWRSDAGLRCYLSDSPRAQGFTVTELGDEVGG